MWLNKVDEGRKWEKNHKVAESAHVVPCTSFKGLAFTSNEMEIH